MAKPKTYEHSIQIKLDDDTFNFVEEFRRKQANIPNRSQAIRDLIELAMNTNKRKKPSK
nr:hypothetical protein [uncultured Mediterranean phage uvMED]